MGSSITMYISLVATSGVFTLFLCLYVYLKREEIPGARTFMLYTVAQAVYIFAVTFEMTSTTLEEMMRWTVVQYIGMAPAPVLGLIVILQYIGKSVSRQLTVALLIIPVVSFLMVATNDYHHLFYHSIAPRAGAALPLTDIVIGQFYVVHGAYTFGCMLAGVVLLVRRWRHTKKAYRLQLATLITGQLMPMIGAFIYLMGLVPAGVDPVPVIICATSAMYLWAIVTTRLLTIVPIAKESLFESMGEGVIVLDNSNRLIDFNGAACRMLPGLTVRMMGLSLDVAWTRLSGSVFPVDRLSEVGQAELNWTGSGGASCFYQVRQSVVRDRFGETLGSLLMLIDVTEQRRLQDQLKQLAYYDGLTKLLNRTAFIQRSKALLQETLKQGATLSVVLFDIDHFKVINDTYGHETGDYAIRHIVGIVQRMLSPEALLARYGGEEFVFCLPSCDLAEAGNMAERIRASLADEPFSAEGETLSITASFGIAQSRDKGETLQAMLKRADIALYEAKREGRNRVRLSQDEARTG